MSETHEPMAVRFEATDEDIHINPPFDQWRWTDLKKLRWRAGCAEQSTGLRINVTTDDGNPGVYGYALGEASYNKAGGLYTFAEMWAWFDGIDICWEEAEWDER